MSATISLPAFITPGPDAGFHLSLAGDAWFVHPYGADLDTLSTDPDARRLTDAETRELETHLQNDMASVRSAARRCGREQADRTSDDDLCEWRDGMPDEDTEYVEQEVLGRPMMDDEAADFAETFRRVYDLEIDRRRGLLETE